MPLNLNEIVTEEEFFISEWTDFRCKDLFRNKSLSHIKNNIIKSNINPYKNNIYKNTDLDRILKQKVKKRMVEEQYIVPAINNVFSPATIIGDGFISRHGVHYNSTPHFAGDKIHKHYTNFFQPTGYISDISTLGTTGLIGITIEKTNSFMDLDLVYTSISNSESPKCITAYVDIAPYSKVCIHENVSNNDILRFYNIVYIVREGADVRLSRYYTGKDNSAMHLHHSKFIQHPASKLTITNQNNDCYYLQEFFDITVYQDCSTNINLRYSVKNSSSVHAITDIKHIGKNSKSKISVRSSVDDVSKFSFVGNIDVKEKAGDVDARLENKNLQLSNTASVITEPRLDIRNKNISCTHGCTVSYIDPEDIYFLNARGIDSESAKTIIAEAFLNV